MKRALSKGVLLFDGATGTYAKMLSGFPEGPVEQACLTAPQRVTALHKAYLDAGAAMIKTNTFAAHPGMAAEDEKQQSGIIRAAYALAKQAAEEYHAHVFADIGPALHGEDPAAAYCRMANEFLSAGADCFLFETLPDDKGIREAAACIRAVRPDAFIAVCFAAGPDGYTRTGESVQILLRGMDECADIDAVGLNCICGAYHMRSLLERLDGTRKTLIAMPNAGYPHLVDGRLYYDSDPAYFAEQTAGCIASGAGIVGGCCGTTPAHIAMLSKLIAHSGVEKEEQQSEAASVKNDCGSKILRKLRAGEKPILVEVDPPRSAQIGGFIDGAKRLVSQGADAITIADCPIGRARMDSSILACKLTREYGIETIPHMTCRDRNINATKALLLGLSMEGVRNVLVVTGDPVPSGDRESVKGVFQFNSGVLARFVTSLCASGEAEAFFLCGALNVNAQNFDAELKRALRKEADGVQAFLTQPVLSERAADNLRRAREVLGGYLFGGLFPIVSRKNALFMASEVAGIELDERIAPAYDGLSREQGEAMAIRLCMDAAEKIRPYVDGYYIMTPFQRFNLVAELTRRLKAQEEHAAE
ncbi:MAG: bifunctional homocysteine S-methyltransferase/methylenetetrahydrofolate reductase [Clostridia bacterium]|nr:bifunctional homocysteine S-methyltransferase/methylenetetrahydrofolate reductase [Clostridia bacterium]